MKVPCKGCEDRRLGCHSDCEKYKDFRAVMDARIEARLKQVDANELTAKRYNRRRKAHK